jgi:hypothetical protein
LPAYRSHMLHFLTKSRFTHALDCPTKLYYALHDEYASAVDDNDFLRALAEGGLQVGELARLHYPGGVEIPYSADKAASVEATRELLARDRVVIYEAAIQHGQTYALVDILVKNGNRMDLIEVKSKSWEAGEEFTGRDGTLKPAWQPYLYDVAFQTWVLRHAYPAFEVNPFLMLIDKDRPATVDGLHQYFRIERGEDGRSRIVLAADPSEIDMGDPIMVAVPVPGEVELILQGRAHEPASDLEALGFDAWIDGLCELIRDDRRYPVQIGAKCRSCEYRVDPAKLDGKTSGFAACWSDALNWSSDELEKPHAFDVWNANAKKYMADGIYLMEEITPAYLGEDADTLYTRPTWEGGRGKRQLAQVMKMTGRHNAAEVVLPGLFREMDRWTWPLHFIDFEGISPAIPFHRGVLPYKKMPFQFSVHSVHGDGRAEHTAEWIGRTRGAFPCFDFVRELKRVLERDQGSVFMYHHYERSTLNDVKAMLMASAEPDRAELIDWIDTLVTPGADRELIDQQRLVLHYYYSVRMGGSNSIKEVLPAVLAESAVLKQIYSRPYSGLSIKEKILYREDEAGRVINPYRQLDPVGYGIPAGGDGAGGTEGAGGPEGSGGTAGTDGTERSGSSDGSGGSGGSFESGGDPIRLESGEVISDGGTAMMAWARMQFPDVPEAEREAVFNALLCYCELDTLAMVMIQQHWVGLRG